MANIPDRVRVTVDLPAAEVDALEKLASQQGVSKTEALRRAIATEGLLQERRRAGSKVLLEKNGALSEVIFTR